LSWSRLGLKLQKAKQEEGTIEERDFYDKLFAALEKELGTVGTH
jgi:hypothetical protein